MVRHNNLLQKVQKKRRKLHKKLLLNVARPSLPKVKVKVEARAKAKARAKVEALVRPRRARKTYCADIIWITPGTVTVRKERIARTVMTRRSSMIRVG